MEPYVSLHKHKDKSTKAYPIRILKVDNICIDENHVLLPEPASAPQQPAPAEKHPLTSDEKDDMDTLFESYRAFVAAKTAYETAAETFWKSSTGAKLETILAPDPPYMDRVPLHEKTQGLDSRLASRSIQIRNRNIDISGYNYIVASYTLLMYETQHIPRRHNDFVLHTINEQILEEIPKIWTNKMIIHRKKLVDCVYVFGHVLPPYRLKDIDDTH